MGKACVGIDIGGSKMAVASVSSTGQILGRCLLPTEAELGFERAVGRLAEAIQAVTTQAGPVEIAGIGIGCAGPLDAAAGLINNPYTLKGWDRCDIVTPLRQQFGVPVFLENDADAAALGEFHFGAGRGFDPVVMLTFGTGIGGAAIIQGEVYRGVKGEHPELGHIQVFPDGPGCYCGTRGCLEVLASGTAISEAGRAIGLESTRAVFTAFADGHASATAVIRRALDATASAAWTVCHTFLPQRIVLGGGMMDDHFDLFARAMRERFATATQFSREEVSVARATLGNDAGVVGAAAVALAAS